MKHKRPVLLFAAAIAAGAFLQLRPSAATDESAQKTSGKTTTAVVAKASADETAKSSADETAKSSEEDDENERLLLKFMEKKLTSSSQILRGLMTEDFELIRENAGNLLEMSKEERWRASNDMMYLQHSTQFQNAVKELVTAAEKQSIDGASLQWVNVTMNCMQCHKWVRNVMLADLDLQ